MSFTRRFSSAGIVVLCAVLAACATKNDEYKNSKSLPPLEVPPDLINPPKDSATAVPVLPPAAPAAEEAGATTGAVPAAATAVAATATTSTLRLEREGALRWLVVPGAADAVRARIRDFLLQERFEIAGEDAARGVLETDWRTAEAQGGELNQALAAGLRDKFRVRVEAGRTEGTAEVYVSHSGLQRVTAAGAETWQPRAADPLLEADLLDRLQDFLAGETASAEPAPDLPGVRSVIETGPDSVTTLRLAEDFERAWRRIGFALGRGGFVIEDRNRAEGVYLIRLGKAFKEDANAGFFSRLFGSNAGDPEAQYRVQLQGRGDATVAVVQHPGGAAVRTSIGERILERLKEKME